MVKSGSEEYIAGLLYLCKTNIKVGSTKEVMNELRNCAMLGFIHVFNPNVFEHVTTIPPITGDDIRNMSLIIASLPITHDVNQPGVDEFALVYYTRIYSDGRYLRITIPKAILPEALDIKGRKLNIQLHVNGINLTFKAKVGGAGRSSGKMLYYFIRIPKRTLSGWWIDPKDLQGKEAKVIMTEAKD